MLTFGIRSVLAGIACAVTFAGCAAIRQVARVGSATVAFTGTNAEARGNGVLWQEPTGIVHMELQLVGLPPGTHGIHFHTVGRCEGDFSSAGAHFNPLGKRHGLSSVDGPHAGDLPNITVQSDGTARVDLETDRISLIDGPTNVFDSDGTALIVHAQADDQITDPSGNSGARIACAVVRRT